MDIKQRLEKARATAEMWRLAGYKPITSEPVPEDIPFIRTLYPDSKDDYWHKVGLDDANDEHVNATACIYDLGAGSVFLPHFHINHTEHFIILTPNSKLKIVTYDYIKELTFPNAINFEKNEAHAVINKSNHRVQLLVIWQPRMKKFQLEYLNKKNA